MIVEYEPSGPAPGLITHVIIVHRPELAAHLGALGRSFIESQEQSADPDAMYVTQDRIQKQGRLQKRPAAPIMLTRDTIKADGQDSAFIGGVPAGWQIRIDGRQQTVTDGSNIAITAAIPHVYEIELTGPWPFLPWRGRVSAV